MHLDTEKKAALAGRSRGDAQILRKGLCRCKIGAQVFLRNLSGFLSGKPDLERALRQQM